MISKKHSRFLDEYLIDFNASEAYVRAGYSSKNPRQNSYNLLRRPDVKAELERRFNESRLSKSEVIARIDAIADGKIPTKRVEGSQERTEYDYISAAEKLARVYALFQDKIELNISHLNITDD